MSENFFEELEKKGEWQLPGESKDLIKLNLGCGTGNIQDGYINIDIRDIDDPRVLKHDVRNLPYAPNSIDEIQAIDVYEHISHRESKELLKHWVTLLKPGGIIYIQGPCPSLIAKHILSVSDPQYLEMAIALTYGAQDYPENYHRTAVEPALLAMYLQEAGITGDVSFQERGVNVLVRAFK